MTSPRPELPDDIQSCQALIEQLRGELQAAAGRLAHLEALLAESRETIADQQQTIENLTADNALLKRSLFGPRRERFTDDPAQALLFDAETLEAASRPLQASAEESESPEARDNQKKKRTSKGRQARVFPEFLPREEERFPHEEDDSPEVDFCQNS